MSVFFLSRIMTIKESLLQMFVFTILLINNINCEQSIVRKYLEHFIVEEL